jgi:hypothetical protein
MAMGKPHKIKNQRQAAEAQGKISRKTEDK